ncbi:12429_t:CDS:2, partial [Dentiscutata erythropus]
VDTVAWHALSMYSFICGSMLDDEFLELPILLSDSIFGAYIAHMSLSYEAASSHMIPLSISFLFWHWPLVSNSADRGVGVPPHFSIT